jgi:hypothetical protein
MKRRFFVPAAVVAMVGLMASFATVAQAFPSKTTACTGCHSGVNVPVSATAGAASGTTVSYALAAPTANAVAVFDGATKVATLASTGTFAATAGKTYTAYSVTGPSTSSGVGSTTFTAPAAPIVAPGTPAAPALNAIYNTNTGNLTISWAGVIGATSYDYQVGGGAVMSTTGTSVSLTGLALGSTSLNLRATNSEGSSVFTPTTIVYSLPVVVPTPTTYKVKKHLGVNHRYVKSLRAVLTNKSTGATFTSRLDRKGNVTFANVPAGTYRLTVSGNRRVKFRAQTVVVKAPGAPHSEHHDD